MPRVEREVDSVASELDNLTSGCEAAHRDTAATTSKLKQLVS
jgi:hypothetical protein